MAKPKVSPLHMVIDAPRWDAEPPLGRLFIVAHAAFLDAGFVPHGTKVPKSARLPKQVGRTASTLFLRYTALQLLHRLDVEPAALRLCAHGRHVVFYTRFHVWWWFRRPKETYWVCLDALAAAALLSGRLDDTGRALRNDARVAALWKALSEGLCRRLLVDMCCSYGVALEPTFMSLPGDIKAAILGRLTDGDDLARVERTCTELRRLVAEHDDELWKPRFEALTQNAASLYLPDDEDDGAGTGDSEVNSWKARYMRAKRTSSWGHRFLFSPSWSRFLEPIHYDMAIPMLERDWIIRWSDLLLPTHIWSRSTDRRDPPERRQAADAVPGWMRRREMAWSKNIACHGRCRTAAADGHKKKRHGAAAIHSPSSRYRWKHR